MMDAIIWYVTTLGCAALFFGIGIYAMRREKPMWFWSGSSVEPEEISDIPRYNRANGWMWIGYALWYVAAALMALWSMTAGVIVLCLSGTLGIIGLIFAYRYIYNRYKV